MEQKKPYNDLKLTKEQMLSPQDQATNTYKSQIKQNQDLDNQLK